MEERLIIRLLAMSILVLMSITSVSAQSGSVTDSGLVNPDYRYYDQPIDPELYIVRPGEQLKVTFIGTKLTSMALHVGPDGRVIHRSLGVFDLAGRTLAETRRILADPLMSLYNVDAMEISVSDPYEVAISVTGAVNKPGLYKGFTSQLVSELIEKAGGVSSSASTRRVVFSGGPDDLEVDLDRAKYLGDHAANPCLYAGNHLHVPDKSVATVTIVGAVKDPREIELISGDSFDLLLALAGGMQRSADLSSAYILGDETRKPMGVGAIRRGDIILIPTAEVENDHDVIVMGAVNRPGKYQLDFEMTLEELVAMAGGLTAEANVDRITLFRKPLDRHGAPIDLPYAFRALPASFGSAATWPLQPTDSVFVPTLAGYVKVSGFVRNPGYFMYVKGERARYYIGVAGGFASDADQSELTVYDRVAGTHVLTSPDALVSDGDELIIQRLVAEQ